MDHVQHCVSNTDSQIILAKTVLGCLNAQKMYALQMDYIQQTFI